MENKIIAYTRLGQTAMDKGDLIFTVAMSDVNGDIHTDTFSEALLAGFISKGVKFEYDADNEELVEALQGADLGYMEVSTEQDDETGKDIYDVYYHKVSLDEGELEVDTAGEYCKTYKREASALAFAKKSANAVKGGN